jgi:hypothetical protein
MQKKKRVLKFLEENFPILIQNKKKEEILARIYSIYECRSCSEYCFLDENGDPITIFRENCLPKNWNLILN